MSQQNSAETDKEKKKGLFSKLGFGGGKKKGADSVDNKGPTIHKCFGVPLAQLVSAEQRVDVPWVVAKAIAFLDTESCLSLEGLFRTVPSMSEVQRLQKLFEESGDPETIDLAALGADPHTVGGLLKRFFRELPEPIFTDLLYEKWTNSQSLPARDEIIKEIQRLFSLLPITNRKVIAALFRYLTKLIQYSSSNKLTSTALGVVWQPNLVWSSSPGHSSLDSLKMGPDGTMMGLVISLMVEHFATSFDAPELQSITMSHVASSSSSSNRLEASDHDEGSSSSRSSYEYQPSTASVSTPASPPMSANNPHQKPIGGPPPGVPRGAAPMPGMASAAHAHRDSGGSNDSYSNESMSSPPSSPPVTAASGGAPKLSVQIPPSQPQIGSMPPTPSSGLSTPVTPHTPKTPAAGAGGQPFSGASSSSTSGGSASPSAGKQLLIINGYTQGIVIADFVDQSEGLLSLMRGEPVWVTRKHPDGWYEGWKNGKRGFFPGTYISETTV